MVNLYKSLVRPILFKLDPENAHRLVFKAGRVLEKSVALQHAVNFLFYYENEILNTEVAGIKLDNPVGLAAGFDKNGLLLYVLPDFGFGYAEIGSVTANKSEGNKAPRVFRLVDDKALVNRMGLNNYGADEISSRLHEKKFRIPVGVNIAKTHDPNILGDKAIRDFCYSFVKLSDIGDYFVVNISCPNTKEGKTFEDPEGLDELLSALIETRVVFCDKPVFVKLSPDLSYETLDGILEVSEARGISGYVLTNTSRGRDNLTTSRFRIQEVGNGGLSGKPIRERANAVTSYVYRRLSTSRNISQIIGVGGIDSAEAAYERIRNGASAVQLFTCLVYEGPGLVKRINKGLAELLTRDGFKSVKEAVGIDAYKSINGWSF